MSKDAWLGLAWVLAVALVSLVPLLARWAAKAVVEKAIERKFCEWEVRFSKLHERRVEVMEGTMDRLVALKRALEAASGIQSLADPYGLEHLRTGFRAS